MEKKTLTYIGLLGGIIAIVGLFLAWASVTFTGGTVDITGFNLVTGSITVMGIPVSIGTMGYAVLALVGGIIALIGGIGLLVGKRAIGFLLPIGGLLAIVGGGWGLADVANAIAVTGATLSVGYGIYICIVGGIMALIGSLVLRGK